MDSKQKGAIIIAAIAAIGAAAGGTFMLDFSTNIDQSTTIGDIISNTVNNYISDTLGIDIEKFKENCLADKYIGQEAQDYCELLP